MTSKKQLGRKHKLILEIFGLIIIFLTVYVMLKGWAEITQGQSMYVLLFFTIIMLYFTLKLSAVAHVSLESIIKLIKEKKKSGRYVVLMMVNSVELDAKNINDARDKAREMIKEDIEKKWVLKVIKQK